MGATALSLLEAIVLGVVQGLTEFLPISSTAHLRIIPAFAGWEDPGAAFTAVTQLGTLAAVLLYFRRDLLGIATAWLAGLRDPERRGAAESRLGWFILVGTIPILIFGFVFSDQIETGARSLQLMGTTLIVLGLVLLAAEKVGTRSRSLEALGWRDGIVIGLAQAAALIPGVSRSGATISAGLFRGLNRVAATRVSFLLSIPALLAAGGLEAVSQAKAVSATVGWGPTGLATLVSFVVGFASIAWLLRLVAGHPITVFVPYRVILGIALVVLLVTGAIPAT